jgi:hypothetical protein
MKRTVSICSMSLDSEGRQGYANQSRRRMFPFVNVDESVCLDISSVPPAPMSVNGIEKGKPIISEGILSMSRLCKRIFCNAEIAAGLVRADTPTAWNVPRFFARPFPYLRFFKSLTNLGFLGKNLLFRFF